jgi:fumarate hydratase subunit alpha
MRTLDVQLLTDTTARLLVDANYRIPPDILAALRVAADTEQSEIGRQTLAYLVRNYEVAAAEQLPVCQDSGVTVVRG